MQLKMRHKATEYMKYNASKRVHYPTYTIKILARRYVSIELLNNVFL